MRPLHVPDSLCRRIEAQVRAVPTEEVCGVLLGRRDEAGPRRVLDARPVRNVAPEPRRAYVLAPEELVATLRDARDRQLELVGYYHSHPTGSAEPSATDRAHAWPDVSYLILAAAGGGRFLARSWRLAGDELVEEPIGWGAVDRR